MEDTLYRVLETQAEKLVKERILGERKGLPGEMNYMHSYRVRDLVSDHHHWDDPDYDLFLAALLHDVIEDGEVTYDELRVLGYSERTIELVALCSHDLSVKDNTERWVLMIAKLVEARDEDAWRIKLADLTDNLKQCSGLSLENRRFMIEVKAPLMLRLVKTMGFARMITEEPPFVQPSILALETEMEKQRARMQNESLMSDVTVAKDMRVAIRQEMVRWVASLSLEQVQNLPKEIVLNLAMEDHAHPGRYGFLLPSAEFSSDKHLANTTFTLMKKLNEILG